MTSLDEIVITWLADNGCKVTAGTVDKTPELISMLREACVSDPKRQRVRAHVPLYLRCQAFKANGEQCTRRRRNDCDLCGTHGKGTPHGRVSGSLSQVAHQTKIVTSVKEINGINYHVDTTTQQIYRTEDILAGNRLPRVIGKLVVESDGLKKIS
jgi:hypothetical protein